MPAEIPYNSALSMSRNCCEAFHESAVVPQVRKEAPSRLQGRASSRQGIRDLQEQSAFQGAPALSGTPLSDFDEKGRSVAFFVFGTSARSRRRACIGRGGHGTVRGLLLQRRLLVQECRLFFFSKQGIEPCL